MCIGIATGTIQAFEEGSRHGKHFATRDLPRQCYACSDNRIVSVVTPKQCSLNVIQIVTNLLQIVANILQSFCPDIKHIIEPWRVCVPEILVN